VLQQSFLDRVIVLPDMEHLLYEIMPQIFPEGIMAVETLV